MVTALYVGTHADSPKSDRNCRWIAIENPEAALSTLESEPFDAVVVDTRFSRAQAVLKLLSGMFPEGNLFTGVPRHRVLGIVEGTEAGIRTAFDLGKYHLADVLCDVSVEDVHARVLDMVREPTTGKVAICLAGGGIEGLLYEIGVLRALETFLPRRSIVDFDLFCGISAGAVLGAFLANGIGPSEILRGLMGGSARIEPITRAQLFDPNFKEVGSRASGLMKQLLRSGLSPRAAISSLSRTLPSGAFAGDKLREWLKRQLNQPGMSDSFEGLRRPLFVGATDQDTSSAVVFGEEGYRDVPIHRAVRASAALSPFYAPEEINGRYYVDGAFTRTTNMRVAVRQGATMVILIDPLVPVFSNEAGYVKNRGGLFGSMQGLKALINGRFDKAVKAIHEMYPDVSFYLFRPHKDEMRILSGSPMKYFYRREVEEVAYQHTLDKIRGSFHDLAHAFARHNVEFSDPNRNTDSVLPPPNHRLDPNALDLLKSY